MAGLIRLTRRLSWSFSCQLFNKVGHLVLGVYVAVGFSELDEVLKMYVKVWKLSGERERLTYPIGLCRSKNSRSVSLCRKAGARQASHAGFLAGVWPSKANMSYFWVSRHRAPLVGDHPIRSGSHDQALDEGQAAQHCHVYNGLRDAGAARAVFVQPDCACRMGLGPTSRFELACEGMSMIPGVNNHELVLLQHLVLLLIRLSTLQPH